MAIAEFMLSVSERVSGEGVVESWGGVLVMY